MRCLSLKKIEFLNPKLFFIKNSSFIFLLIVIASCTMSTDDKLIPPSLEKIPNIMEAHGDIRIDNYYWLRDDTRSDPKMLNYLKLENDYADMWFEERTDYKSVIYSELIGRIVLSETSYKIKKGDYLYFNEITSKDQLPKYYRSKDGKKELFIVDDKFGTPTYTYDFANNVEKLIQGNHFGLFNLVCGGQTSRLEVAQEILTILKRDDIKINKVGSSFFAEEYFASRPRSERLINYKLNILQINHMRDWKICLGEYLESYIEEV